jgi:hypothetical protein
MSFWPDDIAAADAISPRQIMKSAGDELTHRTQVLTVSVDENHLADRIVLAFRVINTEYLIDFNLFEVSHRLDQTYPVRIDPPASDIPEFLQRKRYVPGQPGLATGALSLNIQAFTQGKPGKYVENEWVCVTPAEFKEKLKKLFALDHVKTRIISLQAPAIEKTQDGVAESTKEEPFERENEGGPEDEPDLFVESPGAV